MPTFNRPEKPEKISYHQSYIDLVPEDVTDIIRHLKKQGLEMLTLMRTLDDERGDYRYAPDKWSVKEIFGHLIDSERLFSFRALWTARGTASLQPEMDENLWAGYSNAGLRTMADLWSELHACRTDHICLFRSLDQDAIDRRGLVAGIDISAGMIPWIIAGHELHHMNVLRDRYNVG